MSSSGRGAWFWVSAWLPVLIAIGLVACESTPMFGADHTDGPLRHIWEWIFGHVGNERWHIIHAIIRKSGHFIGYGLIGLAWLRAWLKSLPAASFLRVASFALFGTALVASSDEFHQSFLPNRTASPYDVLLDCVGAVVLMTLAYLILRMRRLHRLARTA
jgi:VanZ family protein